MGAGGLLQPPALSSAHSVPKASETDGKTSSEERVAVVQPKGPVDEAPPLGADCGLAAPPAARIEDVAAAASSQGSAGTAAGLAEVSIQSLQLETMVAQPVESSGGCRDSPSPSSSSSVPLKRPPAAARRRELTDVSMHTASKVDRADLVAAVFKSCDSDQDDVLGKDDFWRLAVLTGCDCSCDDWALHYGFLCFELDCPKGVNLDAFRRFLDDRSEDGLYCTDDELSSILAQLRRSSKAASDTMCTAAVKPQWLRARERAESGFYRMSRSGSS
eukprot:TRINITY_DN32927_c0_g1_i3.p1 TRINITY_DN32927_c0_g1~~TRINITY_DN32927_c0_g1_i3.p1  ORF type:complete len:274 (-),score=54.93 TRINITY_DN32927_c0_g1_i3:37-858(-)